MAFSAMSANRMKMYNLVVVSPPWVLTTVPVIFECFLMLFEGFKTWQKLSNRVGGGD